SAPMRKTSRTARFRPRVLESDGTVEDRMACGVVDDIGDEIAVPLKLHALFGRCRNQRRLDARGDHALRVRIQFVEKIAFGDVRSANDVRIAQTNFGARREPEIALRWILAEIVAFDP